MMGLLRQFQRTEQQIYKVVSILLKANYGIDYFPANVPNKYFKQLIIAREPSWRQSIGERK
jgi:hypothetical protein